MAVKYTAHFWHASIEADSADELRAAAIGFAGLTDERFEGLSLSDTLMQITHTAEAADNVLRILGANPYVGDLEAGNPNADTPKANEPEVDGVTKVILERLAKCKSRSEIKQLHSRHKQAFQGNEVLDAAMRERWKEVK